MSGILSREGSSPRVSRFFFTSVDESVLIFGAETWVVPPCMGWVLGGFQYQVAWRLTGRLPQRRLDVKWGYISVEAARSEEGFESM